MADPTPVRVVDAGEWRMIAVSGGVDSLGDRGAQTVGADDDPRRH